MAVNMLSRLSASKTINRVSESVNAKNDAELHDRVISKKYEVVELPLTAITADPFQPRDVFDQDAMKELADDIRVRGLLQPIAVRETEPNKYMIIFGERRYRASKLVGAALIPAVILDIKDEAEILEVQVVENTKRSGFEVLELAAAFSRMTDLSGGSSGAAAKRLGLSPSMASQLSSIHNADTEIKEFIDLSGTSDIRALYELTNLKKKDEIAYLGVLDHIRKGKPVGSLRELVSQASLGNKRKAAARKSKQAARQGASEPQTGFKRVKELSIAQNTYDEFQYIIEVLDAGNSTTKMMIDHNQLRDLQTLIQRLI